MIEKLKKLKICIFPNDPIRAYYDKGEIKPRYFNPNNLFDEIHVISLTESDIEVEKVAMLSGSGKLFIHSVGKINLKNFKKEKERILNLIKKIQPDIIRSYNPLVQGWLGTYVAQKLDKPFIVSLHINYEKDVHPFTKNRGIISYLKFVYTTKKIEPYVLKNADCVICVHNSVASYAKKFGAKRIEVIYNRVFLEQFSNNTEKSMLLDKPTIIYVARLTKEKNQECLIRSILDLDVYLLLVGDGPDLKYLEELATSLDCHKKVKFLKSVSNDEIQKIYSSCDIFAAPVKDKGIGITFLEAMASGIPTVIRKIPNEHEEIDDASLMIENTPEGFKNAFIQILSDKKLKDDLIKKGLDMAKKFDGKKMEEKEMDLYIEIMKKENGN